LLLLLFVFTYSAVQVGSESSRVEKIIFSKKDQIITAEFSFFLSISVFHNYFLSYLDVESQPERDKKKLATHMTYVNATCIT
jgi:hypothetical protein